jgi:hypothetical protein
MSSPDVTLTRVTQTSLACPSQWDGWDEAGNYYYLRYRGGHGSVRQYATPGWADSDEDQLIRHVAAFDHGHPLDGSITLAEFCERAGIALAQDLVRTGFGDHLRDELVTTHGWTFLLKDGTAEASRDCLMPCPCGRGDYALCTSCPCAWCSVHGEQPHDLCSGTTDDGSESPCACACHEKEG